ncbi:MAG: hypothetical protein GY842_14450 [bacterium]|nr:hypothetical protein [bacterium]
MLIVYAEPYSKRATWGETPIVEGVRGLGVTAALGVWRQKHVDEVGAEGSIPGYGREA